MPRYRDRYFAVTVRCGSNVEHAMPPIDVKREAIRACRRRVRACGATEAATPAPRTVRGEVRLVAGDAAPLLLYQVHYTDGVLVVDEL